MIEWKRTIRLALAAAGELSSVGRLLLEERADPNAGSERGFTPPHTAAVNRHDAVARPLLAAGTRMP